MNDASPSVTLDLRAERLRELRETIENTRCLITLSQARTAASIAALALIECDWNKLKTE